MVRTTWSRFDELAKAYVSGAYERGDCGHLRFRGPVSRSYGVAIGVLLTGPRGEKIGLISRWRHSTSTARHIGEVQAAMRSAGYRVIVVGIGAEAVSFAENKRNKAAFLSSFLKENDETIKGLIADIDQRKNPSYVLANVYWNIAKAIRDREFLAEVYGRRWPSPGSADEAQTRGDTIAREVHDKTDPGRHDQDAKARALGERLRRERGMPAAPSFDLALEQWRIGERLLLEDNRHPPDRSYCRFRDGNFELSHRFGFKIKPAEFSKLLAGIAEIHEGGWRGQRRLGTTQVEIRTYGLLMDRRTVHLADLLAAARVGMPRLHRRYAAMFAADDPDPELVPDGPAP